MNDSPSQTDVDALLAMSQDEWDRATDSAPRDLAFAEIFEHVRRFADEQGLRPSQVMAMINAGKVAAGVLWPASAATWV